MLWTVLLSFQLAFACENGLTQGPALYREVHNKKAAIDREKGVRYFTAEERAKHKVAFLSDGSLAWPNGEIVNNHPRAIAFQYVMDVYGDFYLLDPEQYVLAHPGELPSFHSTLLGGESVACAGYMDIANGRMTVVDRDSGHYTPSKSSLDSVRQELIRKGVPGADKLYLDYDSHERIDWTDHWSQ